MKKRKAMRSKIKKKRNETLPLPLLRKHKKTKQAALYTVTESQNENYTLKSVKERAKLEGNDNVPSSTKRFVVLFFVYFWCKRYRNDTLNSMCQL